MRRLIILLIAQFYGLSQTNGQNLKVDSSQYKNLPDVTVIGRNSKSDFQFIPDIVGTNIYAGKKNALIVLENVQGNIVNNTMRQVLAKIPGIHIWESDPSGIQIGVASRGLSPNRSWEFNVRQNGYDIAADPFGYPEAYYNPPLQAVQRIEIIRGQGALQYGPQFGGMINYIIKDGGEIKKPIEFELQQTFGSSGLKNYFNALGGKYGKIQYYTFLDNRSGEGWRNNSQFYTKAGFGTLTYQFNPFLSLTFEIMQSNIRSQQPGGLTDQQIINNPKESFRSRNWMDITWTTPAIILNYQINNQTKWNTKFYGTIGDRNSIGFLQPINIKDSINSQTLSFNNRLVNLDRYRNYGIESRILTSYQLGKFNNTISTGIRFYTGTTNRLADGKGSVNSNYDISIEGNFPKNIEFVSNNIAGFIENIFRVNKKIYLIPGIRYEWLEGAASGINGVSNKAVIQLQNITRSRSFILGGIGSKFNLNENSEFYANISEAYRPIQFANLQAPPSTDMVDPNLKDAKGFNFDFGYKGKFRNYLQFDMSIFYLQYNNRIGTITPTGTSYRLITNVGASISKGFEGYFELNPIRLFSRSNNLDCIIFGSYAYTDAKYSNNHADAATKGKFVENSPTDIFRTGFTLSIKQLQLTFQSSRVSACFSDANNTKIPTPNGNIGLIPGYTVTDITGSIKFSKTINAKAGINNLFNANYFTRRAGGYPGPGALPADGKNYFLSFGVKL